MVLDPKHIVTQRGPKQVAHAQDTEDVFEATAAHHHAGVRAFSNLCANRGVVLFQVDRVDVHARGHDGADPLLVQAQHIGDDGLFALVKDAGLCTLFHQDLDLVVGDRRLLAAFATQQADQQVA